MTRLRLVANRKANVNDGDTEGDATDPGFECDEPTNGDGESNTAAFSVIAGHLSDAVTALRQSATLVPCVHGPSRWSSLRHLSRRAHEVADAAFDLGTTAAAQARIEETKKQK